MIKARDFSKPSPYTLIAEEEVPKDKRTIFKLQYPSLRLMERIDNDSIELVTEGDRSVNKIKTGTAKRVLLLECVKGIENIEMVDGSIGILDVSSPESAENSLNQLDQTVRDELYNELRGNREANEAIRKRKAQAS